MKKLGLLTIILASLACTSFGQMPTTADGLLLLGNQLFEKGAKYDARTAFSECLKLSPNNIDCNRRKLITFFRTNDLLAGLYERSADSAIETANILVQLEPKNYFNHFLRGMINLSLVEKQAIQDFTKAIELNPSHAESYGGRSKAYGIENIQLAINDANKALQLNPNLLEVLEIRSFLHCRQGNLELAEKDENKAIAAGKSLDRVCRLTNAWKERDAGNFENAITLIGQAIQKQPKVTGFYYERAEIYARKLKKYDLALADLGVVLKDSPTHASALDLKKYLEQINPPKLSYFERAMQVRATDRKLALYLFGEAIEENPKNAEAYYQRGDIYFWMTFRDPPNYIVNYKNAYDDFSKAFELDPNHKGAQSSLNSTASTMKKKFGESSIPKVIKVEPKRANAMKQTDKAESILNEGSDLLQNGKVTEAEAKLKTAFTEINKAIEADETYSKPQQLLGLYYFLNSMSPNDKNPNLTRGLAIVAFNKAINLDPKNATAIAGLGVVFEMSGKKAEAKTQYQKALQINPNESAAKEGLKRVGN